MAARSFRFDDRRSDRLSWGRANLCVVLDTDDLCAVAIRAARAAGQVITTWVDADHALDVRAKSQGDWVTAADSAAESAALRVLADATPDIPVLAEEGGGHRTDLMWVVDPLDGTTNFLRGYPEVGVSVALMVDGSPRVGVVAAPFLGRHWSAQEGRGAVDDRGRQLRVRDGDGRGVTATGFPFRNPERRSRYLGAFQATMQAVEDLRRPGAASLDCAYVAAGAWDGYFELGLALWDIAAGGLLVREAGGVVTDWNGDSAAVFDSGDIVAGSPLWHAQMLERIASS